MLLLCSDGLTGKLLLEKVAACVPCGGTAAVVVTADREYKAANYHVARCCGELTSLGLAVDICDIDTAPAQALRRYDVVEFIGGNPFYLLRSIRDHRAADVLQQIAREKLLIGWSAAAFVFGPSLELVNAYSPEWNDVGLTDLRGLSLTGVRVLPHYDRFLRRFDRFEEICRAHEEANHVQVIRLNDGDGVFDDNGAVTICRG
ncbi:MAG: hypothetical protein E7426_02240 [Ruminococcaceae bacterium]|nr:hypothetical protein [Oscillospiraceae bacterium]